MFATPVVLIAFNRPDVTRRNIEVLRRVKPATLYLVVDGPRADHPDDIPACDAVRAILDTVDWECEVVKRYATENLGCEANVVGALDFVFDNVPEAIVLEDDCIADDTFFAYCEELLARYADDRRVWHIAGHRYWVPSEVFGPASYALTTFAPTWGWATWSRAWKEHRAQLPASYMVEATRRGASYQGATRGRPQPGALLTRGCEDMFNQAADQAASEILPWDAHWCLTVAEAGGLAVLPSVNLVSHDGWGPNSSHSNSTREADATFPIQLPLTHPEPGEMNREAEREIELILLRVNGPTAQAIRNIVRSIRLRGFLRKVAHSRTFALIFSFSDRVRLRLRRRQRS